MQNDFLPLQFEGSPSGGSFAVQESRNLVARVSTTTKFKTLEACLVFEDEDESDTILKEILNPLPDIFKTPELSDAGKKHLNDLKVFWTKTRSINELMTALSKYIKNQSGKDLEIIYSRDAHPEGHCSFKNHEGMYPAHCVQGEPGEQINQVIINTATTIQKQSSPQIQQSVVFKACTADADSYSAVPYHSSYPDRESRQVGKCNYQNTKIQEYYRYYPSEPLATGNNDMSIGNLLSNSSKGYVHYYAEVQPPPGPFLDF